MTKLKKTKIIEENFIDEEDTEVELPPKDHNKRARPGGIAVDQLKGIISRIERLEEEKSAIADDIKDVFAEAKGNGFDVKAIKKIIRLRKISAQEREEEETVLHTYMHALGMLPDLEHEDGKED